MIEIAKGLSERRGVFLLRFTTPVSGTEERITEEEREFDMWGNNLKTRRTKQSGIIDAIYT